MVTERAQLHRFRDDRKPRVDVPFLVPEIAGDAVDQEWDVVEKLVGGKDSLLGDGDPGRDAIQPLSGELLFRRAQPVGELARELKWVRIRISRNCCLQLRMSSEVSKNDSRKTRRSNARVTSSA